MDPRHRLALDDADEDTRPWQAAGSVPAHKLARFAGTNRKSKFELEREAEQERERAAKEDAARAYDEFVEAFGGDEEVGPSQGGKPRIGGAGRSKGKGFVRAGGDEKYDPLAGRPEQQTGPQTSGPAAGPSAPAAAPRAPRAMLQPQAAAFVPRHQNRPTAATLMGDDDEVRSPLLSLALYRRASGVLTFSVIAHDRLRHPRRPWYPAGRSARATRSSSNSRGSLPFLHPPFSHSCSGAGALPTST